MESSRVLPALRNLSLEVPSELVRKTAQALQYPAVYPCTSAALLRDSRAGFLRQARLLSSRKRAEKLMAKQSAAKLKAQKLLLHRVKQVTDTPLLEGGLYEYRKKQLRERAKRMWRLKATGPNSPSGPASEEATRSRVKVRLLDGQIPRWSMPQEPVPVVYLQDLHGVRSLYKFSQHDLFIPGSPSSSSSSSSHRYMLMPESLKHARHPKTTPGLVTKWV